MRRILLGVATAMLTIGSAAAQTMAPQSGTAAASGNDNQAVATTAANAPTPAQGHNSFTQGEASRRIASDGFGNVHGLVKNDDGVWRGHATRGGTPVSVWLDYKGNVGSGANKE